MIITDMPIANAMDMSMGLAALVGLGAALVVMYLVLRKYTYPAVEEPFFSDPRLFMLFTVGLVEGTILFVVYTYLWEYYTVPGAGLIVAILFGAVMELVKLVTMNLKRFVGISDSIFYGFGLGLGMGAAMAFGTIYYWCNGMDGADVASIIIVVLLAMQFLFLNTSTGTTMGEGIARRRPMEFALRNVLINAVCQVLAVPFYMGSSEWLMYLSLGISTVVVAYVFYNTIYVKLPRVVDDVLKMNGKTRNDIPGLR